MNSLFPGTGVKFYSQGAYEAFRTNCKGRGHSPQDCPHIWHHLQVQGVPKSSPGLVFSRKTYRTHWDLVYSQLWFSTRNRYRLRSAKGRDTQDRARKFPDTELLGSFIEGGDICCVTPTCDSLHRVVPTREAHLNLGVLFLLGLHYAGMVGRLHVADDHLQATDTGRLNTLALSHVLIFLGWPIPQCKSHW